MRIILKKNLCNYHGRQTLVRQLPLARMLRAKREKRSQACFLCGPFFAAGAVNWDFLIFDRLFATLKSIKKQAPPNKVSKFAGPVAHRRARSLNFPSGLLPVPTFPSFHFSTGLLSFFPSFHEPRINMLCRARGRLPDRGHLNQYPWAIFKRPWRSFGDSSEKNGFSFKFEN